MRHKIDDRDHITAKQSPHCAAFTGMAQQQSPMRKAKEEELEDTTVALSSADQHNENNSDPPSPTGDDDEQSGTGGAPLQKRRRVTRACDECRRKVRTQLLFTSGKLTQLRKSNATGSSHAHIVPFTVMVG